MLNDSQKSSALEQVKRELRSILLSSKLGVPLRQIKADYEILSCNRLPFRDFGFNDVESFMRSMPDVATEKRSPDGEIVYHAVCDDTTIHIQKLISSQKAPSRKKRGGKFAPRSRGAFRSGRGMRGSFKGFGGHAHSATASKPRFPLFGRGGSRGYRGSTTASSFRTMSGDLRSKINQGWKDKSLETTSYISSDKSDNEDWDKENLVISPLAHNLQIGVNKSGERTISKPGDLRDYLNAQRARHVSGESRHSDGSGSSGKGEDSRKTDSNVNKNTPMKRVNRPYHNAYVPKEVAPRFLRKQQENQNFKKVSEGIMSNVKSSAELNDSYQETPASKNWLPPERGEEYLAAFHEYFTQLDATEPPIEVVQGKFNKRNGFYGRIMYQGKMLFPLEILQNQEEARQNAARSFCLKFGISLPGDALPAEHGPREALPAEHGPREALPAEHSPREALPAEHSPREALPAEHSPREALPAEHSPSEALSVEQSPSEALPVEQSPKVAMRPPHETLPRSSQPKFSSPVMEPVPHSPISQEIKVKIYKIIGDRGVFLKKLPDLYRETYSETLGQDIIDKLKECPEFFNVEEPVPNRFIVYQMPDALNKIPETVMGNGKALKCLEWQLPDVGTMFEAMFSYAYSGDEIFFQKTESSDVLYHIEDSLAKHCKESSVPDKEHLLEGSFIAASYGGDWYRAHVVNQDSAKVTVSFIDYGNREEVMISDTRLLPQDEQVNNTPPLAIPCMARKTRQGEWCENVSEILSSISETYPFLTIEVMHLAGSHCVVDISLPDERSINSMLMRRPSGIIAPIVSSPDDLMSPHSLSADDQFTSPSTKAAAQLLSYSVQSPTSHKMVPAKVFTEDPEPLSLPESESFGAYVCCVMSESSVLLRVVEDEYSGKLDELETSIAEQFTQWPHPAKIQPCNVYACVLHSEGDDDYHRVRVLKISAKDGVCECYLLDHGGKENVNKEHIRHIDTNLNKSLPYQAIYATLYGLDNLPSQHKVVATKVLIRLTVEANVTFVAVRKDRKQIASTDGKKCYDSLVIDRVRKIISCLTDLDPTKVAKIYEDIFRVKLNDVEEIIKLIPGYGLWKHGVVVELIDCSAEDDESSVNNTILTLLQEIAHLKAAGTDEKQALKDVLGSDSSSQADTAEISNQGDFSDSGSTGKGEGFKASDLQSGMDDGPSKSASPDSPCDISHNASVPRSQPKLLRNCPAIPPYVEFEIDQFCAIYILRSESPSYFVAMPYEQRDELSKLEQAMKDTLSDAPKTALVFSKSCMYAVERDGIWRRTIYVGQIQHMHEVFYPDYHLFDTVTARQLFVLPSQFYSQPLLARKMALGGVRPLSQDWSEAAKYWFIQNTQCKDLYGLILSVDNLDSSIASLSKDSISSRCAHLPSLLYAQLVDTSGDEDVVLDQQLYEKGWARKVNF